jgi:hypothetical protein
VVALKGGPVALLSAIGAAGLCACVIALISRTGRDDTALPPTHHQEFVQEEDI